MLLVICILIVNVNGSWWRPNWIPPTSDTSCSFTRDDVFRVLKQYVDVNPKDDKITEKEVEEAGIFVVVYFDKQGKLVRKQAYEEEEYERILCEDQ